jgi:hypothetical protein
VFELALIEGSEMCDRIVNSGCHVAGDGGRFTLAVTEAEPPGRNVDAIEARERITDSLIASFTNVIDELSDRCSQRGLKNIVESAMENLVSGSDIHF